MFATRLLKYSPGLARRSGKRLLVCLWHYWLTRFLSCQKKFSDNADEGKGFSEILFKLNIMTFACWVVKSSSCQGQRSAQELRQRLLGFPAKEAVTDQKVFL